MGHEMSTYEATPARHRAPRLWIIESLIVLGVLGFGYFAITMDSSMFPGAPAKLGLPSDPVAELMR
jgi:hypothetical protein